MKKIVAPVIVTFVILAFIALYASLYFFVIDTLAIKTIAKIIILAIAVGLSAVMIAVLVQRIKEIKGGEEDDLGKY